MTAEIIESQESKSPATKELLGGTDTSSESDDQATTKAGPSELDNLLTKVNCLKSEHFVSEDNVFKD